VRTKSRASKVSVPYATMFCGAFTSATALAIPIVIAVLQGVTTSGMNALGMAVLLQFVVSFGFIVVRGQRHGGKQRQSGERQCPVLRDPGILEAWVRVAFRRLLCHRHSAPPSANAGSIAFIGEVCLAFNQTATVRLPPLDHFDGPMAATRQVYCVRDDQECRPLAMFTRAGFRQDDPGATAPRFAGTIATTGE
jgi:hypothetical protein